MTLYEEFLETATDEEVYDIETVQKRINDGSVWHLEGAEGREASRLLKAGLCELGYKRHKDFWGNVVPSRFDLKPGTMGAPINTRLI